MSAQENKSEEKGHNKQVTIKVNGREKVVPKEELSFEEIVALAFDNPPTGPNVVFTIKYRKEHGKEQSLLPGETVKVKEGMIFNVTATDRS
jgi:hypothetical protein